MYTVEYTTLAERQAAIETAEANSMVMLHDDFTATGRILTFDSPAAETAETLYQRQLALEMNSAHEQAIAAYKNWGSLTLAQKDTILKNLVKWALWKDGWLKFGVL